MNVRDKFDEETFSIANILVLVESNEEANYVLALAPPLKHTQSGLSFLH